jgi:hypothetical protein
MAETEALARMAEKVSEEIFSLFKWTEHGSRNQNWDCVCQEEHQKTTHPSDIVFSYDHPYSSQRIFLNVDLKSYGASSINKGKLISAVENLALSVTCANLSTDWGNRYASQYADREIAGLLFVYNHDGEYDKDFDSLLEKVEFDKVPLRPNRKLYVFGPKQTTYLINIAHDLKLKFASENNEFSFHYPDLVHAHPHTQSQDAASIELLLSPWQIVKPKKKDTKIDYLCCYYNGIGESLDEFKYLIDYFFRYQILDDDLKIRILAPFACPEAGRNLKNAKDAYAGDFYKLREFRARLDRIEYYPMSTVNMRFSAENIGMEHRNYK